MIEIRGLTKRFGPNLAVDDLTLSIREGEVLGLLGPNGAGKTTTVRMLACLIAPTSGTATIDGLQVGRDDHQIRQIVGILTEAPGLYERLTAQQNLDYFARLYGMEEDRRAAQMEQLAAAAGAVGAAERARGGVLQGDEAEGRHRPGAGPRAEGAVPGRAHLRPGPGIGPHRCATSSPS